MKPKTRILSIIAMASASLASGQNLIYHYDFDANDGTGTTVNDVSGFGAPAHGTTYSGTPLFNGETDRFGSAIPSPNGGFYADFSGTNDQDRTRLMVEDTSKFDSQIAGGSGTGAFTVTMMLRDLAVVGAGNSRDGLFWGERFSGGDGNRVGLHQAAPGATTDVSALPMEVRVNGTTASLGNVDLTNSAVGDSNGWLFMALTYSVADDTARLHVAKELSGGVWVDLTEVGSATIAATSIDSLTRGLVYGGSYQRNNPKARYDDFRVYDGVLDASALAAIPEPSTHAALFGLLAIGFVAWRRRRGA